MTGRRRRRGNGEGTITRRKDGRWQGAIYVRTTAGVRRREYVYGRERNEVIAKLTELLTTVQQDIPVPHEKWTVEQYLNYWLSTIVRPHRKPKTYQGYELVVRRYWIPHLGKRKLRSLSPQDVRDVLAALVERGGLSERSVQFVHAVLRNALENAVREERVLRNVARLVKVPGPRYEVGRGLNVDQAKAVLAAARSDRLHALYVLALYLGLRRGELLGLRWIDVDLETATLRVVQTLQRVGGELRFVRPKTHHSIRTIPLPDVCAAALKDHARVQGRERLGAGADWRETGLIFTTRVGTPIEPDNLRRSWYQVRKVLGEPPVRFHDLRHTCVSLLLDLGVAPHTVKEIVGHSAIDVTMTIYAHTSLDSKRAALKLLDERLSEAY